jgi:hypothetical protein
MVAKGGGVAPGSTLRVVALGFGGARGHHARGRRQAGCYFTWGCERLPKRGRCIAGRRSTSWWRRSAAGGGAARATPTPVGHLLAHQHRDVATVRHVLRAHVAQDVEGVFAFLVFAFLGKQEGHLIARPGQCTTSTTAVTMREGGGCCTPSCTDRPGPREGAASSRDQHAPLPHCSSQGTVPARYPEGRTDARSPGKQEPKGVRGPRTIPRRMHRHACTNQGAPSGSKSGRGNSRGGKEKPSQLAGLTQAGLFGAHCSLLLRAHTLALYEPVVETIPANRRDLRSLTMASQAPLSRVSVPAGVGGCGGWGGGGYTPRPAMRLRAGEEHAVAGGGGADTRLRSRADSP